MRAASHNVIDFERHRKARRVEASPEAWLLAVEPRRAARFTLEWLPAWFDLVAIVADERRRAAQTQRLMAP